ncbi:MAG: response regulator [Patescibacteria group bacterium]|jgi:DNA-binding response OmpR family regulator
MIKILLVEDDPLMVRMYQRKLTNDGYEVAVGVNGEEGLVKVRSFRPDLVLLDIMMPKLNGLQMLERMKADPTISGVPVIILTNLGGSQEDIERGLELGAVAYLVKSAYRPDEVVLKVKEVLKGYTRGKEIPEAASSRAAEEVFEETSATPSEPMPSAKPTQKTVEEKEKFEDTTRK